MVAFAKHELQIQCWNVQGAFFNNDGDRYSKMHNDVDFEGHTKKYLIFGLIETYRRRYSSYANTRLSLFPSMPKKAQEGPKKRRDLCVCT